jgi:GNAT superfamily N-acetyltransferase
MGDTPQKQTVGHQDDRRRIPVRDGRPICGKARACGFSVRLIERGERPIQVRSPQLAASVIRPLQDNSNDVVGVVWVTPATLQGIALLGGIFVDPARWNHGFGRVLFGAAEARAKGMKAGALMIYAGPSAEGFYKRMGAIRIGEGPFFFSPERANPCFNHALREQRSAQS